MKCTRLSHAILTSFAAALLSLIVFLPSASAQRFPNGTELAKRLIQKSIQDKGEVDLSHIGDRACLVPEMLYAPFHARRLFPNFTISYQETGASEGVWFLIIGITGSRTIEIYGIPQKLLHWSVPEDAIASDVTVCPAKISISSVRGLATIATIGGKPQ
jgi:hypothetical protein